MGFKQTNAIIKYNYIMRYKSGENVKHIIDEMIEKGILKTAENNLQYTERIKTLIKWNKLFDEFGVEGLVSKTGIYATGRKPKRDKNGTLDPSELTREELEWFYRRYTTGEWPKKKKEKFKEIDKEIKNGSPFTKSRICSIFGVTRQGFNYWKKNNTVGNGRYDSVLLKQIEETFYERRRAYGYRRITVLLNKRDIAIGEKTTLRYMQYLGLKSKVRAKRKNREQKNIGFQTDDQILGKWKANAPFEKIYTDISQVQTKQGWGYLSITIDGFNNEILDYKFEMNKGNMIAIPNLRDTLLKIPNSAKTIIHSDHGSEYTSFQYNELKKTFRFLQSMGRVGKSLDNRPPEYFFSVIKQEYLSDYYGVDFEIMKKIIDVSIYDYNNIRFQGNLQNKTPHEYATPTM